MILEREIKLIKDMEMECVHKQDVEDAIEHGKLVSDLAVLLSKELHLSDDFCEDIAIAGMVHDIGKLRLGQYLYGRKENSLKIEEVKYMRMHSQLSYEVLIQKVNYSERILMAVYHHHENMDGTGYPSNLKGDEIPYAAKILRPCDVFAALISERPYRSAFDVDTAIELMIEEIKNFDMKVFLAFMYIMNSKEFGNTKSYIETRNERARMKNRYA